MNEQAFSQIVDTAVGFSVQNRRQYFEHFKQIRAGMHPAAFAREFCTVHIDLGRRTGKTTYIKQRAEPGDVIITMTADALRRDFSQIDVDCYAAWMIAAERFQQSYRGKAPRLIFIDEPELVQHYCKLETIYNLFAGDTPDQTFILLGH
jgi:hypothetical protein